MIVPLAIDHFFRSRVQLPCSRDGPCHACRLNHYWLPYLRYGYTKLSSYHFDSADQMKSLVGRNILFSSSDDGNDTRISRDIGVAAYARSSLCPRFKTIATRLLTAKLVPNLTSQRRFYLRKSWAWTDRFVNWPPYGVYSKGNDEWRRRKRWDRSSLLLCRQRDRPWMACSAHSHTKWTQSLEDLVFKCHFYWRVSSENRG